MSDSHSVVLLVAVASAGNILGAVVNWGLGRGIERFAGRRWFPITPNRLERAAGWYRRYGRWSLLFSWAPFIGDPLNVAAGVLRAPLATKSEERRVGKECVSKCRSRWSPYQ